MSHLKARKGARSAAAPKRTSRTRITPRLDVVRRGVAEKLTVLARKLWLSFDQHAENRGQTRAKWVLITTVGRHPGATQRAIASLLRVTEVTAGRMIDRLCADGYLERRENPDDRRSYLVFLTPAAQPVLQQLGEIATLHGRQAFAGFEEEDLATLESLLDALLVNVARMRGRQGE